METDKAAQRDIRQINEVPRAKHLASETAQWRFKEYIAIKDIGEKDKWLNN